MSSYRFTTQANLDLEEIGLYICKRNPVAADRFLTRLDQTCELLAAHPSIGRLRPEFGEGLRSVPISNYLIFYQPDAAGIRVIRVLYGGRDLPSVFHPD